MRNYERFLLLKKPPKAERGKRYYEAQRAGMSLSDIAAEFNTNKNNVSSSIAAYKKTMRPE